jgi:lysozyme
MGIEGGVVFRKPMSEALAIEVIKHFESCRLQEYLVFGRTAIGWGRDVTAGSYPAGITQAEADAFLSADVMYFANAVKVALGHKIEVGSWNAFTSFSYNVGLGQHKPHVEGFLTSTALVRYLEGEIVACASELLKWDHVAGVQVPGLLARRRCEAGVLEGRSLAWLESSKWFQG